MQTEAQYLQIVGVIVGVGGITGCWPCFDTLSYASEVSLLSDRVLGWVDISVWHGTAFIVFFWLLLYC